MYLPWLLCAVLLGTVLVLLIKIWSMHRSMDQICVDLGEWLARDTNTLLSVSTGDRHIRRLAAGLNRELRLLRRQRQRYQNGDRELKEAVTNISHDLRTPLTAIFGYLDLLAREKNSENAVRYLSYIQNRAEALKQLTEELFRYSVILSTAGDLTLEPVSLNGALEEAAAAYYAALTERGITPVISMPEQQVQRLLNREALSRVFSNVLSNALKYSDGDLEIVLQSSGEICFANSASKLDEVQVGQLFDRFYSVESARNATGLGLAISKTLVEQMHGSIEARYAAGKLQICIMFPDARLL